MYTAQSDKLTAQSIKVIFPLLMFTAQPIKLASILSLHRLPVKHVLGRALCHSPQLWRCAGKCGCWERVSYRVNTSHTMTCTVTYMYMHIHVVYCMCTYTVCMCIQVCVHVCACARMYAHAHTCMYVRAHTCMYAHTHVQ